MRGVRAGGLGVHDTLAWSCRILAAFAMKSKAIKAHGRCFSVKEKSSSLDVSAKCSVI